MVDATDVQVTTPVEPDLMSSVEALIALVRSKTTDQNSVAMCNVEQLMYQALRIYQENV